MKTKMNPALVGVFVLGALALTVTALLTFGGVSFFSKPQRFVVSFDETIHGLDLGSPVKVRGVRAGRVVDLNVHYNAKTNHSRVVVVCELTRKVVVNDEGGMIDLSSRKELEEMVRRGLRAQLGVQGLATGLLYVELTFEDPDLYPLGETVAGAPLLEVPSIPSSMAEAYASAMQILSNLKKIDFPGLEKDVRALLVDTRKQINTANLADVTAEWARAGKAVTALTESPEIRQTFVNLNAAIEALKATVDGIDKQVGPAGEQLGEVLAQAKSTLKTFESAAASARTFISAQGGLGEEATQALMQLSEAALSVQRLTEFLERNPSALITGRKPPQ